MASATSCLSDIEDVQKEFSISRHGFLPPEPPLVALDDPYFGPWEELVRDLPQYIRSSTIRTRVEALPLLDASRLDDERQVRRAYSTLTFLAHAYIWGGENPAELELPPVLTYAAGNLWNYTTTGGGEVPIDLDSLECVNSFTGTRSESWFFMVSIAIESAGGAIIPRMLEAFAAVKSKDYATITAALGELSTCLRETGLILDRMHEQCDPTVFFHDIRPFLAGSRNMANAGLPRGVFYNEGDGKGSWRQLRGGSNGQSSLIQFFDVVLGVEHTSNGNNAQGRPKQEEQDQSERLLSFHEEVRNYMPGPHRKFLEYLAAQPSIRALVTAANGYEPEQVALQAAYKHATQRLAEFRNRHLSIVSRFIVLPSLRPPLGHRRNLASAQARSIPTNLPEANKSARRDSAELTGTGGTALMPFLKQSRDETIKAGIEATSC